MAISERTPWSPLRRLIDHNDVPKSCRYDRDTPVSVILQDMEIARFHGDMAIRKMMLATGENMPGVVDPKDIIIGFTDAIDWPKPKDIDNGKQK